VGTYLYNTYTVHHSTLAPELKLSNGIRFSAHSRLNPAVEKVLVF